jgi:hypothetical protein
MVKINALVLDDVFLFAFTDGVDTACMYSTMIIQNYGTSSVACVMCQSILQCTLSLSLSVFLYLVSIHFISVAHGLTAGCGQRRRSCW